jgi:alanyl-tRNA synthetase
LALAALAAFLFFNNKKAFEFISLLQERLNAKEKELEELKKIEEEQKRKQQEIEAKFQATLEELKEKHKIEIEKIDSAKRQELRRLIEQYQENPEEQSRHLAELFGLSTGA